MTSAVSTLHEPFDGLARFARDRLLAPPPDTAVALLGALLVRRELGGRPTIARIVETEAYAEDDPASHSFRGPTPRNAAMFAAPGTAYVYRSYGVHWCLNVAVGPEGHGAAVLLRAACVVEGGDRVRARRRAATRDAELLRGPGCLTAGLEVSRAAHDGIDLLSDRAEVRLMADGWWPARDEVASGPRVGIRHAADRPWRFWVAGSPCVSRYRPAVSRRDRRAG
jgi:DNA-3-methyladenine glycosylase